MPPIPGEVEAPAVKRWENVLKVVKQRTGLGKGDGKPPKLRSPEDAKLAELRRRAVRAAVNELVSGFRGRGGGTPPLSR